MSLLQCCVIVFNECDVKGEIPSAVNVPMFPFSKVLVNPKILFLVTGQSHDSNSVLKYWK